jgi:hypothetical protein
MTMIIVAARISELAVGGQFPLTKIVRHLKRIRRRSLSVLFL